MAKTNIRSRVRSAWRVLTGKEETRPVRRYPVRRKENPFVWPAWVDGEPSWDMLQYSAYAEHGFEKNALIYAAIMYKTRALTAAPLRAYVGDPDRPELAPGSHALTKLISNPNEHQSFVEYMSQAVVYMNLSGNSYTMLDRDNGDGDLPGALYGLRPDRVGIVPNDGKILGYMYKPESMSIREAHPILAEDMMHVKTPNPSDPFEGMGRGLSPIAPMAQSGDVDNEITKFLKTFFERGVMLPGYLKFKEPLDPDEMARVKERWKQIYGGARNWGEEIGVIDSEAEYHQLGLNFKDMEFASLDDRNEARILSALGVSPILIGSRLGLVRSTDTNYKNARTAFWEDTMIPELHWFEVEFQRHLNTSDAFVKFDVSRVPALRRTTMAESIQGAYRLWLMGYEPAQATMAMGLSIGEPDVKDVVRPTSDSAPLKDLDQPRRRQLKATGYSSEEKQRIWKAIDDIAINNETAFQDEAVALFEVEMREVLALVGEQKKKAIQRKEGPIVWGNLTDDVTEIIQAAGDDWREAFIPLVEGVVNDAGEFWGTELGIAFDVRNWRGEEWFDQYMLEFASPIGDTSRDTLHAILAQGQAEGWSVQEMQDAIELTFQQWMEGNISSEDYAFVQQRLPAYRVEAIARTETVRAANKGTVELGREWGAKEKEWLATMDGRARDSHAAADGQRVALDNNFRVGGYDMQHPGDASNGAPAREFVNCRCSTLLIMEE